MKIRIALLVVLNMIALGFLAFAVNMNNLRQSAADIHVKYVTYLDRNTTSIIAHVYADENLLQHVQEVHLHSLDFYPTSFIGNKMSGGRNWSFPNGLPVGKFEAVVTILYPDGEEQEVTVPDSEIAIAFELRNGPTAIYREPGKNPFAQIKRVDNLVGFCQVGDIADQVVYMQVVTDLGIGWIKWQDVNVAPWFQLQFNLNDPACPQSQ